MRLRAVVFAVLGCALAAAACEDPARPIPEIGGASAFVDSDPRGARIIVDGDETALVTPALIDDLEEGARSIRLELDTLGFTYTASALVVVAQQLEPSVMLPLTVRCSAAECLRANAEVHAPGTARFVINAAGPLFIYDGLDQGIVWPTTTPNNSYAAKGAATIAALVDGEAAALGLRNAGDQPNYWAGRPLPTLTGTDPYHLSVSAWITPPGATSSSRMRGLEIVHDVVVDDALPGVIEVRVTWRNISTDSIYRALDDEIAPEGVTFSDAWLGFILDADIGVFAESSDDLVSYDAGRRMVFAYDSDFAVAGFSGGWADRPALLGLLLLDGPGASVRLNAWPLSADFSTGFTDASGRLLVAAQQSLPENHPDGRIGFAPDTEADDYLLSVATGPVSLAPGESASARFAVILAPPAAGAFTSGQIQPAGDPLDGSRPLAAIAAPLLLLADSALGAAAP